MTVPVAVFASGSGTNLQALLDHFAHDATATIRLVVSDRSDAGALRRAQEQGVAAVHVPVRDRPAADVARDTLAILDEHGIQLVALAGYLRLIPERVTQRFERRIINIHPALLPAFGGAGMYGRRVHEAVLAAGCRVSGATVHFVTPHYDEGTIIAQWPVPVLPEDTAVTLAARVLDLEHRLYPVALHAVARAIADGGEPIMAHVRGTLYRLAESADGLERDISAITVV